MAEWSVSWHLIPDGISTIVKVAIEGEFVVNTANAENEAQAVAAQLIARLTGRETAEVLRALQAEAEARRWFGDVPRPDEPPPRSPGAS